MITTTVSETKTIVATEKNYQKGSISIKLAPAGEFVKDGKTIKYGNRVKIGNGFKTIGDFRSQEQVEALLDIMKRSSFLKWVQENLPETAVETESEVDES